MQTTKIKARVMDVLNEADKTWRVVLHAADGSLTTHRLPLLLVERAYDAHQLARLQDVELDESGEVVALNDP
jgi:hypothetical protein